MQDPWEGSRRQTPMRAQGAKHHRRQRATTPDFHPRRASRAGTPTTLMFVNGFFPGLARKFSGPGEGLLDLRTGQGRAAPGGARRLLLGHAQQVGEGPGTAGESFEGQQARQPIFGPGRPRGRCVSPRLGGGGGRPRGRRSA